MNIKQISGLDPNILTIVFLTDATLESTYKSLPAVIAESFDFSVSLSDEKSTQYHITRNEKCIIIGVGKAADFTPEKLRKNLHNAVGIANQHKVEKLQIVFHLPSGTPDPEIYGITFGEIPVLSSYEFNLYKSEIKNPRTLKEIDVHTNIEQAENLIKEGFNLAEAVCATRNLVNEPPNTLTSVEMAKRAAEFGHQFGFSATIFDKAKITELGMGGLLAVNKGSQDPPTFTILEWKPENATNSTPIALVGKGVVFDTGGLSLKPTPGSMDSMKCDMAGAGVVIGAFIALARNNINKHVIGLIPSTDNRPGENAYTPNDVIKMFNGMTVEVLNTDAEGRMILADALAYAKNYNPELVIDLATLTGSAVLATGVQGCPIMSTASEETNKKMIKSGQRVFERLVEFPLWEEYDELIKSDIADMKNIGGRYAGSITAAKFLQRFVSYPWMHIDIAGPAYLDSADSYRPKNGTGFGVRLLYDFLKNY